MSISRVNPRAEGTVRNKAIRDCNSTGNTDKRFHAQIITRIDVNIVGINLRNISIYIYIRCAKRGGARYVNFARALSLIKP